MLFVLGPVFEFVYSSDGEENWYEEEQPSDESEMLSQVVYTYYAPFSMLKRVIINFPAHTRYKGTYGETLQEKYSEKKQGMDSLHIYVVK